MNATEIRLLKEAETRAKTGDGKSNFHLKVSQGLLPKPARIGVRGARWPAHEIDAVLAARLAGANEDQVRALVSRLHERRQQQYAAVLAQVAA